MKCSFCGTAIKPGTGKMYVKNDGTLFYFCSRKCERSMSMGRDPKKRKWSRKK